MESSVINLFDSLKVKTSSNTTSLPGAWTGTHFLRCPFWFHLCIHLTPKLANHLLPISGYPLGVPNNSLDALERSWRVGFVGLGIFLHSSCEILLMEKNRSCTSWYGKHPICLQSFIHVRWLFGIFSINSTSGVGEWEPNIIQLVAEPPICEICSSNWINFPILGVKRKVLKTTPTYVYIYLFYKWVCMYLCVCVDRLNRRKTSITMFSVLQGDTACHWDCVQRSYQWHGIPELATLAYLLLDGGWLGDLVETLVLLDSFFSQAVCFTIMKQGTSSFMTSALDALVFVKVCNLWRVSDKVPQGRGVAPVQLLSRITLDYPNRMSNLHF